jgi:polyribonucleotide nucleotidyltransferase
MIKASTMSMEVGMEFRGKVTRLMGRGAMVEMPGGRDGMVPTDQITDKPIRRPDDAVEIGDVINVRVAEIDDMGRVNLSALGLNPDHARINNPVPTEGPSRDDRGGRGGYGGRGRGRDDRGRGGRGGGGGGRGGDRDRGGSGRDGDDVNARFRPRN